MKKKNDKGFTLIELLIVIVILGILSGVVVFAVSGVSDTAQTNACQADKRALQTAAEAYRAQEGAYPVDAGGDTAEKVLADAGFLNSESDLYDLTSGTADVTVQDAKCN